MSTRNIDTIQSAQIAQLELDVESLRDVYTLVVADIIAFTPKVNACINNLINIINCVRSSSYSGSSGDGVLKRLTEFDDYYSEHIERKFPPIVDISGVPRVGYTGLNHAHPNNWQCQTGTCVTATITVGNLPWTTVSIGNVQFVPYAADGLAPSGWSYKGDARASIYVLNSSVISADFAHLHFGGSHENNSYGYGWTNGQAMMTRAGQGDNTGPNKWFHGTVTSTGSQCEGVPVVNAGVLRAPAMSSAPSNFGDDAPDVGGPAAPPLPASTLVSGNPAETSSHHVLEAVSQINQGDMQTTVQNASVLLGYKGGVKQLFIDDPKKAKRARKLVKQTLNRLRK